MALLDPSPECQLNVGFSNMAEKERRPRKSSRPQRHLNSASIILANTCENTDDEEDYIQEEVDETLDDKNDSDFIPTEFRCDDDNVSPKKKSKLNHGGLPGHAKKESKEHIYDFQIPDPVVVIGEDGIKKVKMFSCGNCGKLCRHRSSYIAHYKSCSGSSVVPDFTLVDGRYRCQQCGKLYELRTSLMRHMRLHTDEDRYKCKVCDRQFTDLKSLNGHTLIHTGEKPFICDVCGVCFRDKSTLNKHHRRHGNPEDRVFKCDICEKGFFQKVDLNKHKKIHEQDREYKCDQCYKQFYLKAALTRHLLVHSGERPFHCEQCDHFFSDSSGLRNHMRLHSGDRPHCCETCGKAFSYRGPLIRHMKTHGSKNLELTCMFCLEKFPDKPQLDVHKESHTGDRPYQCTVCLAIFANFLELKSHRRCHRTAKNYQCLMCGKVFSRNASKLRHLRQVHGHETSLHDGEKEDEDESSDAVNGGNDKMEVLIDSVPELSFQFINSMAATVKNVIDNANFDSDVVGETNYDAFIDDVNTVKKAYEENVDKDGNKTDSDNDESDNSNNSGNV